VDFVEDIAQIKLKRSYKLDAPNGVNRRNSDNTRIRRYLNWEASIRLRYGTAKLRYGTAKLRYGTAKLRYGTAKTYAWIKNEMRVGTH
jgi:hypothetical protein